MKSTTGNLSWLEVTQDILYTGMYLELLGAYSQNALIILS